MTDHQTPDAPDEGGDPFASSLADLEAHVAAAERAGEGVAPEARMMLERLRELSGAMRALTASLGATQAAATRAAGHAPDDAPNESPEDASDQPPNDVPNDVPDEAPDEAPDASPDRPADR